MGALERIGGEELLTVLREADEKLGDGKRMPIGPNGRMRHCARCSKNQAEYERYDSSWVPPLCESWLSNGRVHWSSTCRACGQIEADERKAAAVKKTEPIQSPQIGMSRSVTYGRSAGQQGVAP